MKKFIFSFLSFVLLLALGACNKQPIEGDGSGMLTVCWDEVGTKGATTTLTGEKAINSLVFFIFDHNGMLDIAHTCTAAEITAKSASIEVKTGTKTVYALANFTGTPLTNINGATMLSQLEDVNFDLSMNTTSNFAMWAKKTGVNVTTSGGSTGNMSLSRYVAKVALKSVTNSLPAPYGTVTVKQAFLCNVVGNQNVAGSAALTTWYNQQATPDHGGANHVIGTGSYAAQCSELTYKAPGTNVASGATASYSLTDANGVYFYGMRNTVTTLPGTTGYSTPFSQTCSVLMLVVTIKSVDYYYPIPLTKGGSTLNANTDNTVDVTIVGLGNTIDEGVFNRIEKGSLTATVTVTEWASGSSYTESI